ncbi:MAG: Uma2 family endonuclease [Planctomycetaceae bacterium]
MSLALKLTVAEYDAMVAKGAFDDLNQKIELIYGEIQAMNPAGPVHDYYIELLNQWSVRNAAPEQTSVRVQSGLSLPELDSRPEPDIAWVKPRRYVDRHPGSEDVQLIIEVSDSSLPKDRDTKAGLYAKAGIVEYWIVNVAEECIHVYQKPGSDSYTELKTFAAGNSVAPLIRPEATLDPGQLFHG